MIMRDRFTSSGATVALASLSFLIGCSSSSDPAPPLASPPAPAAGPPALGGVPTSGAYDARSLIVRFKDAPHRSSQRAAQATALARIGGTVLDRNGDGVYDRFANLDRSGRLMKVDLPEDITVETALAELRRDPAVAYAEPNYVVRALAVPDDGLFGRLHGLHNTGQIGGVPDADIDAPEAWEVTTGSHHLVVGLLDTGVDHRHEDLAPNLWVNPGEIPENRIDDDGNGVIDDVHGFSAIDGSGDPFDDDFHGTHVAGVIGATGNNGRGTTGVNWNVSILPLKNLFGGGGGLVADAITAIDYALGLRRSGVNLRVISASWGGYFYSEAFKEAIEALDEADVLFVAAAGNNGNDNDTNPLYPASYDVPNVISVAATDPSDELASFSNLGASSVDLGAPGVQVMTTLPGDRYEWRNGTSLAAPHVAGAAALLLSANEALTTAQVKELLLTTGDPLPSLAGKTLTGARLNVARALEAMGPRVPSVELRVEASARSNAIVINQGATARYPLELGALAGFSGEVDLTVTSTPPLDAAIVLEPARVAVPGASAITVATGLDTAPGFYNLTVTATHGALVRSRTVGLRVRPSGTVDVERASADTPRVIPREDPFGINSFIYVEDQLDLQSVMVDLDIAHEFISTLRVTLTSPSGTEVVLHEEGDGATASNIHRRYVLPVEFLDEQTQGIWTLHVHETLLAPGTLQGWRLSLAGVPTGPTFALVSAEAELNLAQGQGGTAQIELAARRGFTGEVALSVRSWPPLAGQLSISPSPLAAPGAATLQVSTTCDTAPGTYQLTVTGRGGPGGSITKMARLQLVVSAFGQRAVTVSSSHAPLPIPDDSLLGRSSALEISESFPISTLTVEVHITHSRIMDLVVELIAPDGGVAVLHDRAGRVADDIHRTYAVPRFAGQDLEGEWRLRVTDRQEIFAGSLDRWTLRAAGEAPPPPPEAAFTHQVAGRSVAFTDGSTGRACGGAGIVSWAWDFGDGATSSAQHPTHTFASGGTYAVTLTVTDATGATDSASAPVAVEGALRLSIERISRSRATHEYLVDLAWTGAQGALVELHRSGQLVDLPDNDGAHRDRFRRYETAFTWQVCELRSAVCSNEVSVVFGTETLVSGEAAEPGEVTISMERANGEPISRVVKIEEVD